MSRNESSTTAFSDRASRGWRISLGLITAATGGIILGWPDVAVVTVAIIVGIYLIVAGVIRVVTALPGKAVNASTRILYLLLGLLLVAAGLLCLSAPFHATALLVTLVGLSWIVSGGVELCHGLTGGGGWTAASGAVGLAAGIIVLAYPAPSARAMVWLFGLSLVAIGLVLFVAAVVDTASRRR